MKTVAERLTDAINAAGVPVHGCALLNADQQAEPHWHVLTRAVSEHRVRIDFVSEPSAADLLTAQTTLDTFDPTPRRKRTLAAIDSDIEALTTSQRAMVGRAVRAWVARESHEVRALIKSLSSGTVDIQPDEPDA